MDNKDYIVGIDIGSSKVVMAVGTRNDEGVVSVLGVEVQEIEGCVKDGDILNYIELGNAIEKAKKALEGELGRRLNSAYVGVSGRSVYCVRYEDYVDIDNKTGCVTESELRELNTRIEMVVPGGGDAIIDRIPLRYRIDDNQECKNPLGSFGRKLSATYLFVLAGKQQVEFVNRALYRADMKVCGLCVTPTLLPELLLSNTESEDGVAIVDIGADITDISVVREGKLWYFSSLPIGASSINSDLQEFLRTPKKYIDSLKRKYGSALAECVPDDVTVPVKTAGHAKKQVLQRNIAEIAEERLKDIAALVARELKVAKVSMSKIPCGIVLTGGSAFLENIDRLFARELQMEVRMGSMLYGVDYDSQQRVSAFPQSSVVALLLYGAKHNACDTLPELGQLHTEVKDTPPASPGPAPQGGDIFTAPQPPIDTPQPPVTPPQPPIDVPQPPVVPPEEEKEKDTNVVVPESGDADKPKGKKRGLSGMFSAIKGWLDDAFTEDEYIY